MHAWQGYEIESFYIRVDWTLSSPEELRRGVVLDVAPDGRPDLVEVEAGGQAGPPRQRRAQHLRLRRVRVPVPRAHRHLQGALLQWTGRVNKGASDLALLV